MKENLAVIFGGKSCEHDISIISAIQAIKNIDENYYNIIPIYITKQGTMLTGKKLLNLETYSNFSSKNTKQATFVSGDKNLYVKGTFGYKKAVCIDVCLVVMHGENGEDGKIMSMLSLCNIPYSACDQMQSAICMDKCVFKDYLKGIKIKTVDGVAVKFYDYNKNPEKVKKYVCENVGFPLIVKPATLGSSIGIKVCKNIEELEYGFSEGFSFCNKVLIEKFLEDIKEVNVAVMGYNDEVIVSETEEPIKQNSFLTFDNKYIGDNKKGMENLKRIVPANINKKTENKIIKTAIKLFNELGLKGVVRFDFIVDNKTENVYLNEVNTIPGSLAYYLFSPINISYKMLLNKLIKYAYIANKNENTIIKTFKSSVLDKVNIGKGIKK